MGSPPGGGNGNPPGGGNGRPPGIGGIPLGPGKGGSGMPRPPGAVTLSQIHVYERVCRGTNEESCPEAYPAYQKEGVEGRLLHMKSAGI